MGFTTYLDRKMQREVKWTEFKKKKKADSEQQS